MLLGLCKLREIKKQTPACARAVNNGLGTVGLGGFYQFKISLVFLIFQKLIMSLQRQSPSLDGDDFTVNFSDYPGVLR